LTNRLTQSRGPVVVLTDQPVDYRNPRVIAVVPDRPVRNVGIALIAAGTEPHPQVMVRLKNDSPAKSVHLRVASGAAVVDRDVIFTGDSATIFVDLPALADTVTAEIVSDDDIPADNIARLTRQHTGITLDVAGGVAPEVRRLADVFNRNRPGGRHLLLSDLPTPGQGVQVVGGAGGDETLVALTTRENPLTTGVSAWPGPATDAKPPTDFRVIVERGGRPMVAVHESSPRQIWTNLDLSKWSRTTDFVVFFGNVFESFRADGGDDFVSSPPVPLGTEWKRVDDRAVPANVPLGLWPGLYQSDDGRMLAINAPVEWSKGMGGPSSVDPDLVLVHSRQGRVSLIPVTCDFALMSIFGALFVWPRRGNVIHRSVGLPDSRRL
jgi:hypothetical protein